MSEDKRCYRVSVSSVFINKHSSAQVRPSPGRANTRSISKCGRGDKTFMSTPLFPVSRIRSQFATAERGKRWKHKGSSISKLERQVRFLFTVPMSSTHQKALLLV